MRPTPLGYRYPSLFNPQFVEFISPDEYNPFYDDIYDAAEMFERDIEAEVRIKQSEPGRFVWETDDGDFLCLSEMATKHLFYTLRMLFNHSVPPVFRIGWCPKNRHEGVFDWPADYREQAIRKIYHELTEHRSDLDPDLQEELDDMERNATVIVALGI
jgi:hypothetical protein